MTLGPVSSVTSCQAPYRACTMARRGRKGRNAMTLYRLWGLLLGVVLLIPGAGAAQLAL